MSQLYLHQPAVFRQVNELSQWLEKTTIEPPLNHHFPMDFQHRHPGARQWLRGGAPGGSTAAGLDGHGAQRASASMAFPWSLGSSKRINNG